MKLLFDLPEKDQAVFDTSVGKDEKVMYCLPYNFEGDKRVDGYMVVTDKYEVTLFLIKLMLWYKVLLRKIN